MEARRSWSGWLRYVQRLGAVMRQLRGWALVSKCQAWGEGSGFRCQALGLGFGIHVIREGRGKRGRERVTTANCMASDAPSSSRRHGDVSGAEAGGEGDDPGQGHLRAIAVGLDVVCAL